jgi:poly(glycerol-phosphate) alpha-glucosyltransferase
MRHAARAAAARHDDRPIVAEWGNVERAAARRHHREQVPLEASVSRYRLRFRRGRLLVRARLAGAARGASATITLREKESGAVLRKRAPAKHRLSWTLDERETEFLGTRHPLVGSIVVEHGASRAEFTVGLRSPDPRSLARRLLQRLRRPRKNPPDEAPAE